MIDSEQAAKDWLRALPECDDAAFTRLERLAAALVEENERQNLVSAGSLTSVWQRHIADSAQLLCHVPRETSSPWLDLGTGAGFPGLVIAALRPKHGWSWSNRGRCGRPGWSRCESPWGWSRPRSCRNDSNWSKANYSGPYLPAHSRRLIACCAYPQDFPQPTRYGCCPRDARHSRSCKSCGVGIICSTWNNR